MSALPHAGARDITHVLADQAAHRGEHPFLVWEPFGTPRQVWSYEHFDAASAQVAGGLVRHGVQAGDRVLIHLTNCPEFLLTWFACARIGAVAVTTNANSAEAELRYYAQQSRPVLAVTQPKFYRIVRACLPDHPVVVTATDGGDAPGDRTPADATAFDLVAAASPVPLRPAEPGALLSCQFTSGTTSRPKGVLWTHANATWGARVTAVQQGLVDSDVHYVTNPLFHTNAQTYSVLPTLWVGGTVVLSPRFSASRFWDVSLRNRCTWHSVTNFAINALLLRERPERHHYRMWGGAASAPDTATPFGVPTLGWWGMTETLTQALVAEPYQANRPGSMGRPSPFYGIEIRHEDGRPVAPGEAGELFVRGERGVSLFLEYLDDPQATADAFDADGWLRTGDVVALEQDGSITFSDRLKDMIKVGGENVAASEVEVVIRTLPDVEDVAVVGQPHALLDEVPVAFVVLRDRAADLSALRADVYSACHTQLASFKLPWDVIVLDELPRALLQKVAKVELRRTLPTLGPDVRASALRPVG